jgi:TetR/AcrR family transcriptional regulator, transcriptional repressor for nem operon
MRVTKEKAAENRAAILAAASRLFRRRGIDGVGVAEIAKEAGLTHGALYAHFTSKEALTAEAFSLGFAHNMEQSRAWAAEHQARFDEHIEGLLSTRMRDSMEAGCPMAASASEIGRQGDAVSASFTEAFVQMADMLEKLLETTIPPRQRRSLAIAAVAAEIGAVAASRAMLKSDPALANEVLAAMQDLLKGAHKTRAAKRSRVEGG